MCGYMYWYDFVCQTNDTKLVQQFRYKMMQNLERRVGIMAAIYESAKEWNLLGRVFKEALSVEYFEVMIRTWNGKQCNCSFCHTCVLQRMQRWYLCILITHILSLSTHFVHVSPHILLHNHNYVISLSANSAGH